MEYKVRLNGLVFYKKIQKESGNLMPQIHVEFIDKKSVKKLINYDPTPGVGFLQSRELKPEVVITETIIFVHRTGGRYVTDDPSISDQNKLLKRMIKTYNDHCIREDGLVSKTFASHIGDSITNIDPSIGLHEISHWKDNMLRREATGTGRGEFFRMLFNLVVNKKMLESDLTEYMKYCFQSDDGWNGILSLNHIRNFKTFITNTVESCVLGNAHNDYIDLEDVEEPYFKPYTGFCWKFFGSGIRINHSFNHRNSAKISYYNLDKMERCDHCSRHQTSQIEDLYMREVNGDYWCIQCFEDYSRYCERCDSDFDEENGSYSNRDDNWYCHNCLEESYNQSIRGYSDNPSLTYYEWNRVKGIHEVANQKRFMPYYGVELEVESADGGIDKYEIAEEISEYGGDLHKFFWCKEDGSLSDGFEICSHPMTFEAWADMNLDEAIFKHRGDIRSYFTKTCGIHIHMNRSAFSDLHVLKFMTFIHEYKKFTHFISQRKAMDEYNNYAKFKAGDTRLAQRYMAQNIRGKKLDLKENLNRFTYCTLNHGEKYVPVNLQHTNTIEIRVFKGNLKEVSFRKNIDFLDALYYWSKNIPLKKLSIRSFMEYVEENKKKYANLNTYVSERNEDYQKSLIFAKEVPEGLNINR
tara:strand:- start:1126 stop:3039 length:1914 start_codon:yes stop_codon:yes gene_type:complete